MTYSTERRTGITDSREITDMLEYSRKTILALIIAVAAIWIVFLGYRWKVRHSSAELSLSAEYTSINLKASRSDIIIERGSGNNIVIRGSRISSFSGYPEGSAITVTPKEHRYAKGIITIQLPYSNLNAIAISASAGDIDASGINAESLSLSVNAGNIKIAGAAAESIFISSKAGDIEMLDSSCNDLKLTTATGDIEAIGVDCSSAAVKATTGDIYLEPDHIKDIDIEVTTGDAELRLNEEPGEIAVSTSLGDISCNGESIASGRILGSGTASGSIKSRTGDISVYY